MSALDEKRDSRPWPFKREPEPENFNNPWTPEEESELLRLRSEGVSFPRIADRLKRSVRAVEARLGLIRRLERDEGGTDPSPNFKPVAYPPGQDPMAELANHNIEVAPPGNDAVRQAGEDRPMTLGEILDRLPEDLPRDLPVTLDGRGEVKAVSVAYASRPDGRTVDQPTEILLIGTPDEDEEAGT